MNYDKYVYITPPRAENVTYPDTLHLYQKRGWWLQVKMNGTNSTVYLPPHDQGDPFARTRHGDEPHRSWEFTEKSIRLFRQLQTKKWHVFSCELLHSKGHGVRDVNYLHDVLVYEGNYLLGSTVSHRQAMLKTLMGTKVGEMQETDTHFVVDPHLWLTKNRTRAFKKTFESLTFPLAEGVMLKNPAGQLSASDNSGWMVKCRKPTKNFGA